MPTFILPHMTLAGALLLIAALVIVVGVVSATDAVLKMRTAARTRHFRDQQFVAQAAAEVRNV